MHCYKHPIKNAIGICKSCNKGLCTECVVDVGQGIACKDSCEQDVKNINEIIYKNKMIYKKSKATYYRSALIYGLLSLVFIIYPFFGDSILMSLFLPVGIIFLIATAFMIYTGANLDSKEDLNT